jgi:class 3 adenylate cyclase
MLSSAERRLTAIMFTDVVGYSTLTQRDEALALELLQFHRDLVRPIFRSFGGNEIKTMGDAFLVEFQSAIQAVKCAIAIQREFKLYNASVESGRALQLRIGLHIGDVVFESNDVFGDGVNLASRIYTQASPGGICFTRSVYDQVFNKLDVPIRKLGSQRLKSIQQPVELFAIEVDQAPVGRRVILNVGLAVVVGALLVATYLAYTRFQDTASEDLAVEDTTVVDPVENAITELSTEESGDVSTKPMASEQEEPLNTPVVSNESGVDRSKKNVPAQERSSDPLDAYKKKYASVMATSTWYDVQRALVRSRDMGSLNFYPSRDSLPNREGAMVIVIDPNAASNSSVDAFLLFTESRFINLKTNEEISSLSQRYPGKREIWVRYQQ